MIDIALKKRQGNFLVDVAFTASQDGTTALFGHSGAGKTSVINMISGLARPDDGYIRINGHTVFDSRKKINLPPEKRRFGYVFQEGRLFPHLSVKSNLLYGMKRTPAGEKSVKTDQVVELLGIGHLMQRRPATLSGGEKQRVAIGRALLTNPLLLLMDEPLASLDEARKAEVLPFIARLSKHLSIPILYVSHALGEIINLADTLVFLSDGKVKASGPLEEIVRRNDFRQLSGGTQSGTIIKASVAEHDTDNRLTKLSFVGRQLISPLIRLPVGEELRLWIRSRDVGLSLDKICNSSFQNIFRGRVISIEQDHETGLADIQVDIGIPLCVTITQQAAGNLGLCPGKDVYALIKSISVSCASSLALE